MSDSDSQGGILSEREMSSDDSDSGGEEEVVLSEKAMTKHVKALTDEGAFSLSCLLPSFTINMDYWTKNMAQWGRRLVRLK
jgi:hypothetical protein